MKIFNIILILSTIIILTTLNKDVPKDSAKHIIKLSNAISSGTGFYVEYKDKIYLISNKHVCGANTHMISVDGISKVIVNSTKHDLCILQSKRTTGLKLAITELESLDLVHVIGHPLGNPITARQGRYISQLEIIDIEMGEGLIDIMTLSVPVFGGSSGSPVLNKYGRVSGVIFGLDIRTHQDSLAVPKKDLIEFLEENIKK